MNKNPIDAATRKKAQDIRFSYAVQAPAGSGKTELLNLRFLRLLAICEKPEEVLAITFTRKAANEMSNRILNTLESAANNQSKTNFKSQHEEDRFSAAKAVLQRDAQLEWHLLESPSRLRIQTIDSFCLFLARNLPVLSNCGGEVQVSDRPDECYQQAIDDFLGLLDKDLSISPAIGRLLLQLDNNTAKVSKLLIELLKKRDQWIGPIIYSAESPDLVFNQLQDNITELIEESTARANTLVQPHKTILVELASFAASNLPKNGTNPIRSLLKLNNLPRTNAEDLANWQGLANLLITTKKNEPTWRKQVDKRLGFPTSSGNKQDEELFKAKKKTMHKLLAELAQGDNQLLLSTLNYLRLLPAQEDINHDFLKLLTEVLPTLLAQLRVTFAAKNTVDYPEITHAALSVLGDDVSPTDLALSLDYRINHILVDEFQDTSSMQQILLEKLTAGWEQTDGRTVFVVGDAMQSCYGFRDANVGLFLALRENGLGNIPLIPIDLQTNFRSNASIVEWVNSVFSSSFPQRNNISLGAVKYTYSSAQNPEDIKPAVNTRCYTFEDNNRTDALQAEARYIANQILKLRRAESPETIAILVRGRSHLLHILPALREASVPWVATDIDKLDKLPLVSDLTALLKAILNQADRLAWLSVLRAPWSGIPLQDLLIIANTDFETSILQSLCNTGIQTTVSRDSYERIIRIAPILSEAVRLRDRLPLGDLLRQTFHCLGGIHLIQSQYEQDSVDVFFDLINQIERSTQLVNANDLEEQVKDTFASNNPLSSSDKPVQIMTIHKSKGLEFDHVFLPGLARKPKTAERELLLRYERLNHANVPKLFLAAVAGPGKSRDVLYELLRHEKLTKSKLEHTRLMYIGVTRAIKSVYLSAVLKQEDKDLVNPDTHSLLSSVWSAIRDTKLVEFILADGKPNEKVMERMSINPLQRPIVLRRIPISKLPRPAKKKIVKDFSVNNQSNSQQEVGEPLPQRVLLNSQIGDFIHEALQTFLLKNDLLSKHNLDIQKQRWQQNLLRHGFDLRTIQNAVEYIEDSLQKTLSSRELGWIFDHSQTESVAEYELQSKDTDVIQNHVIDRSFIDLEGIRWIIDYKSTKKPDHTTENQFIVKQVALYQSQLQRYRNLFRTEQNKGVKTALLFTNIPRLVEVETSSL